MILKKVLLSLSFYAAFVCAVVLFCAAPAFAKPEPQPQPVATPDEKQATPDEKPPEKLVRTSCGGGVEGDVVVKCGMG